MDWNARQSYCISGCKRRSTRLQPRIAAVRSNPASSGKPQTDSSPLQQLSPNRDIARETGERESPRYSLGQSRSLETCGAAPSDPEPKWHTDTQFAAVVR